MRSIKANEPEETKNVMQSESKKGAEMLLSILLAVSVSYALTLYIGFDDITWLSFSILSVAIAIFVIYSLLELKLSALSDFLMLLSFGTGMLFPFSLGKAWNYKIISSGTESVSGLWWNINYLYGHLGVLGACFVFWGLSLHFIDGRPEKAKKLFWAGGLLILLCGISFVVKYGSVFHG